MGSQDDKMRRGVLAEDYKQNCSDITSSITYNIDLIEGNFLAFNARNLLRMFRIFRDTVTKYGLTHNQEFTDAFRDYNFEEMKRLVEKAAVAKEILSEYVDDITTLSESETSSSESDGS